LVKEKSSETNPDIYNLEENRNNNISFELTILCGLTTGKKFP
jgi:hypothetical protein